MNHRRLRCEVIQEQLTPDVFFTVDGLGSNLIPYAYKMGHHNGEWKREMEQYSKDVVNVFWEYWVYDEKKKEMIIHKLEWVLTDHEDLDGLPLLPLLMPSTLTCMGEALIQVPNAMNEVSGNKYDFVIRNECELVST